MQILSNTHKYYSLAIFGPVTVSNHEEHDKTQIMLHNVHNTTKTIKEARVNQLVNLLVEQ